jgi:23S rRNA (uracil1939-C5)-methyltransferase
MQIGDTVSITIDDIAQGGEGVGRLDDGRVVFVPKTLPGERVEGRLTEVKDNFLRCDLVEVLDPSPRRRQPDCPHFSTCGGCQFWHTDYEDELELKVHAAQEALQRISGIEDWPEPTVVEAPEPTRYRTRATFHRRPRPDGEGRGIGFFAPGSHRLVEVEDCPITRASVCRARRDVEEGLEELGDVDLLVESASDEAAVITIKVDELPGQPPQSLVSLASRIDEIDSIRGIRIVGGDRVWEEGDCTVDGDQVLADLPIDSLRMPAGLFRQSNRQANRRLVEVVAQAVDAGGAGTVLELFSGSGNLSFAMVDEIDALLGLEVDERAVELANTIARFAGIETWMFREADLADGFLDDLEPEEHGIFDQIVLDPARGGAPDVSRELASLQEQVAPTRVTYVSCDPPALGRDLDVLSDGGWKPVEVTMLDMFPRTAHLEVVAVLERTR